MNLPGGCSVTSCMTAAAGDSWTSEQENNYAELAYETVKLEISMGDNPYKGEDIPMMVARRDQVSDIVTL